MKRLWLGVALIAVLACDAPVSRWSQGTILVHKCSGERVVALESPVSGKIRCRIPGESKGCEGTYAYRARVFYDEELMTLHDWDMMQLRDEIRRYELLLPPRGRDKKNPTNRI